MREIPKFENSNENIPEEENEKEIINQPDLKLGKELIKDHVTVEKIEDKSPLKSGEIFDPEEELARIFSLKSGDRRSQLAAFKEKLAFQKEGLSTIQETLAENIRQNPNGSANAFFESVGELVDKYGLSPYQKGCTFHMINEYCKVHKQSYELRRKYPEDINLYKGIFGRQPKGKVEVIEGPYFYFRLHDLRDFAFVQSRAFAKKRELQPEDIEYADKIAGASVNVPLSKADIVILAENAGGREFDENSENTMKHEEQHAIEGLFDKRIQPHDFYKEFEEAKTDNERALIVKRHFRFIRQMGEEKAKGEILAYLKEAQDASLMKDGLFNIMTNLDYYNFFPHTEEYTSDLLGLEVDEEKKQAVEEFAEKIFVNEFENNIKDGIGSFCKLEKMGYSKEKIIAALIQEPLSKWKKVVKRLANKPISNNASI